MKNGKDGIKLRIIFHNVARLAAKSTFLVVMSGLIISESSSDTYLYFRVSHKLIYTIMAVT